MSMYSTMFNIDRSLPPFDAVNVTLPTSNATYPYPVFVIDGALFSVLVLVDGVERATQSQHDTGEVTNQWE